MQSNPMAGKINMVGEAGSSRRVHSDVGAAGDTEDGDSKRRVCTRRIFIGNCVIAGILGAVVVAMAIVGMTTEAAFVRMLRDTPNQIGLYLLLAVGVIMVLMSALGACGGRSAARGGGGGCGLGCYLGRWVRMAATVVACSVCNAPTHALVPGASDLTRPRPCPAHSRDGDPIPRYSLRSPRPLPPTLHPSPSHS